MPRNSPARSIAPMSDACSTTQIIVESRRGSRQIDAELVLGQIEAPRARAHAFTERDERRRETPALVRRLSQEMIREAKRRLSTDARKTRQLGREIIDRGHWSRYSASRDESRSRFVTASVIQTAA